MTRVDFKLQELLHILTLCAAHDFMVCRTCNAIVTQISWTEWRKNETLGGRGGTPPQPNSLETDVSSLENLFRSTNG